MVVNASPGGSKDDPSMADTRDVEPVEQLLPGGGIDATFKQFVRGKSAVEEVEKMVDSLQASLLIIGLRKRTPTSRNAFPGQCGPGTATFGSMPGIGSEGQVISIMAGVGLQPVVGHQRPLPPFDIIARVKGNSWLGYAGKGVSNCWTTVVAFGLSLAAVSSAS